MKKTISKDTKSTHITIRVSADLRDKAAKTAKITGVSVSTVLRSALEKFCEKTK